MSDDVKELSHIIQTEADSILTELGLLDILRQYGKPSVQGSYSLQLMTWRDLDIDLEVESFDVSTFFALGQQLAARLQPAKMSYRDERSGKSPHLPKGLYWGIYASLADQAWKIDIWAIDLLQFKQKEEQLRVLQKKLDAAKRSTILQLKNELCRHPEYRKSFFSIDVYEAVFQGVASIEQFSRWLKANRGLSYAF